MHKNLLKTIGFSSVPPGDPVAVACSGGPDSMALTLLLAEWTETSGSTLVAVTVDHGLRRESATEAKEVGRVLAVRGTQHTVLTWEGKKPRANIQEAARNARYGLLTRYCQSNTIKHLFVAHTQEDQAETFLLRLARGSGVDGLSCMQPLTQQNGILIHRPLLNVPKAALLEYLKEKKQDYLEDPSNQDPRFDRVKMRRAFPVLATLGLTSERLASTATTMARARVCLEELAQVTLASACDIFPEGYAMLRPFAATEEITLRVFASLVMIIGGHDIKPRLEEVKRLSEAALDPEFKGATLGGCQFIAREGNVLIIREPEAVSPPVSAISAMWDRFALHTDALEGTVGALTQEGWLQLAKEQGLASNYPDKKILYTLPALRDVSGKLLAVPHLKFRQPGLRFDAVFKGNNIRNEK